MYVQDHVWCTAGCPAGAFSNLIWLDLWKKQVVFFEILSSFWAHSASIISCLWLDFKRLRRLFGMWWERRWLFLCVRWIWHRIWTLVRVLRLFYVRVLVTFFLCGIVCNGLLHVQYNWLLHVQCSHIFVNMLDDYQTIVYVFVSSS